MLLIQVFPSNLKKSYVDLKFGQKFVFIYLCVWCLGVYTGNKYDYLNDIRFLDVFSIVNEASFFHYRHSTEIKTSKDMDA